MLDSTGITSSTNDGHAPAQGPSSGGAPTPRPPELPPDDPFAGLEGQAPALRDALELAARAARSDAPLLLLGETGTGKELVARAVHAASPRARGPLITLDCGALPEGLLEAELFGVVRGAFTGAVEDKDGLLAAAHGGTLLLDEVGELPLAAQAKLLRALAEGEARALGATRPRRFDVRVVAATNRDLEGLVEAGAFRRDLLFRLAVVVVRLPPLRERAGDLPRLAAALFPEVARRGLTPAAREALEAHPWPGNVRELRNALRRALAVAPPGRAIDVPDLGLAAPRIGPATRARARRADAAARSLELQPAAQRLPTVDEARRAALLGALAAEDGHVARAARRAGVHTATLYRLLERWGIDR